MSEEFLRVARQEVGQDITEIGNLLKNCKNDADIVKLASDLEKHVHKIKGLAPMMGQEQIGQIAVLLDKILKVILAGKLLPGTYQTLTNSYEFMKNAVDGSSNGFDALVSQIKNTHKDVL